MKSFLSFILLISLQCFSQNIEPFYLNGPIYIDMTNDSIVMNKYLEFNSFKFYITDNTFQREYTFNDKKITSRTVILGNFRQMHGDHICVKKSKFYIDNAPRIFDLDFIDKVGLSFFFLNLRSRAGIYIIERDKKKSKKVKLIEVRRIIIGYAPQ
ncbi:hypothetical protein [Flavobacterium rhizosphaerae]